MIPFFQATQIPLGPIVIQVWGLFVALGIGVAVLVGRREARRRGLDPEQFTDLACWIIIGALVGARLVHAYAYEPAMYLAHPLALLRVWEGGMSMFGGLIGGALAAWLWMRASRASFLAFADVVAYVLPLGYGIGRIGCFLIHDHPGTLSHFILAVRFPGGARLDHGLLLSLAGFVLFAAFFWHNRRAPKRGFLAFFMIYYGLVRFVLDFFRAWDLPFADARYLGLTPAQYGALALVLCGIALWLRRRTAYAIFQKGRP